MRIEDLIDLLEYYAKDLDNPRVVNHRTGKRVKTAWFDHISGKVYIS
ncbi:Uncharacterised protein [Mycobacteroides abscessus subsp. massiliense]|nr:hypothetical protein [Mycobacteroides abscessus]SKD61123.1 Uncharacterised protein [Mycobacteroides abscessus subsp. massiliense]SKH40797.1 Uncharacterised protein [Mycobacteroides abscessus subsp. massiliense]SKH90439.1 Uncharacterised protein [Mycobacteroides abscessus subsp. massiliense]SKK83759.1 Uncharacterised protein [Mycobacteroides abscessus subsp. massiliense]SKK90191.1 Uncharacterised protein [Mycobacteroides abscessus subsp. massiliense]